MTTQRRRDVAGVTLSGLECDRTLPQQDGTTGNAARCTAGTRSYPFVTHCAISAASMTSLPGDDRHHGRHVGTVATSPVDDQLAGNIGGTTAGTARHRPRPVAYLS